METSHSVPREVYVKQDPRSFHVVANRLHNELMIQIIKETFDIQIDHPGGPPASLARGGYRIQRRFPGAIPVGVGMKLRLHQWLQMFLDDHLRHAVADRGNSQRSCTSVGFRDLHEPHRRWKVAPRGHPIPNLVEVTLQVGLERLDRLSIHPGRAVVSLDLLIGFPDNLFGNSVRLCFRHRFLPSLVDFGP
jgi:hypothetical protein